MPEALKIIIVSLVPAFFWASSDVLSRFVSDKVNPFLGAVLVSFGMFVATTAVFLLTKAPVKELSLTTPKFAIITIISGTVNGIGFYFFFKFLQGGGNFTQGMPIILVFIALITATFGILVFGDTLSPKTIFGFICGVIAIYLLS